MRLRHWLIHGLRHYLQEQVRERRRDQRQVELLDPVDEGQLPPEKHIDVAYALLAPQYSVTAVRAASMARTVRLHLRSTLRALIRRDGALPADVDRELQEILASLAEASPGEPEVTT